MKIMKKKLAVKFSSFIYTKITWHVMQMFLLSGEYFSIEQMQFIAVIVETKTADIFVMKQIVIQH